MKFTPAQLSHLPQTSGVYRFIDGNGTILYIGKAKNLKNRVTSYFIKNADLDTRKSQMIPLICNIEITEVQSEFEALLLEARLIHDCQPKYNILWKDDKHYIYIKITGEEFPRILFSRQEDEKDSEYFGPFPSKRVVREILSFIRSIFPYCTQSPSVKRPCFYTHIGLCSPCPALIRSENESYKKDRAKYIKNIKHIRMLLHGHLTMVEQAVKEEMRQYSQNQQFEFAAVFRDKLQKLEYLIHEYKPAEAYIENPRLARDIWKKEGEELAGILQKYFPTLTTAEHLECYDISNLSGKHATGSMVTFIHGQPDKNFYRRFRIKGLSTPNDFAMLAEVMRRRLKHADWPLPDVFLIDGGKPQLKALGKVFEELSIKRPMVGLAKRFEELVIPTGEDFVKLRFPNSSHALHLLQRLRDEAHRFAGTYHKLLRLKQFIGDLK